MNRETFYRLVENWDSMEEIESDDLKTLIEQYPYFQSARLLYTKKLQLLKHEDYATELGKTAILCADRKKLFYHIYGNEYTEFLSAFEQEKEEKDSTWTMLDSFLSSIEQEEEAPHHVVTDPTLSIISTDYLSYLESLGEISEELESPHSIKHQDLIDSFIEKSEKEGFLSNLETEPEKRPQMPEKEETKDDFLTETLARIYIKQKKYEQALTIIKRISLNFPKKSAYFADQIRFLEHLILNETLKKK